MQINKALATTLMEESPSFRQYVLDTIFATDSAPIINAVKDIVNRNFGNKIAGIKELREYSRGKEMEFSNAFPTITSYSDLGCLSLSDAKKIVEKYGL